ncbi:hypothetical protein ED844_19345 [Escherichia coli]|nr:hypothetical protein [Escherichia coli]EEV7409808.1 hypothetical protein [Escherichia coli]EEY5394257.1 hypothetical protein [Escherichia coli]EFN7849643.1 hypothetical protein [Escherichia coli]EFN8086284.1 hypothetical protein [Escherichia coli]
MVNPIVFMARATEPILPVCDVSTSTIRIFCSIVFLHLKIIRASYHKTKTDADLAAILCAVFPFFNIQ